MVPNAGQSIPFNLPGLNGAIFVVSRAPRSLCGPCHTEPLFFTEDIFPLMWIKNGTASAFFVYTKWVWALPMQ